MDIDIFAVGSIAVGALVGAGTGVVLCYFVVHRSLKLPQASSILGVALGAPVGSYPLGDFAINETLWPWFAIGEGAVFVPFVVAVAGYAFVQKIRRQYESS